MGSKNLLGIVFFVFSHASLLGFGEYNWQFLEENEKENKVVSSLSSECIKMLLDMDTKSKEVVSAKSSKASAVETCIIQSNFIPSEFFLSRASQFFKNVRTKYVRDRCVLWMDLTITSSESFSFLDFFLSSGKYDFFVKGKFPTPHSFIRTTGYFHYSENLQGVYLKIPILNKIKNEAFSFEIWMRKSSTLSWKNAMSLKKKSKLTHLNVFLPNCELCSEVDFLEKISFRPIRGIAENELLSIRKCSECTNFRMSADGIFFSTNFNARLVGFGSPRESARTIFINRPFNFLISTGEAWRYWGIIQAPVGK